jgi:hypothetical protein
VGEVVVTALGIKKEKKKLGFAVSEIQGASLVKARETNVVDNMVGKVAGLTIGQSAELLGTSQIVLRGSDIRRGQSVLFVVDGIPINSDAYNLSPDDIELCKQHKFEYTIPSNLDKNLKQDEVIEELEELEEVEELDDSESDSENQNSDDEIMENPNDSDMEDIVEEELVENSDEDIEVEDNEDEEDEDDYDME